MLQVDGEVSPANDAGEEEEERMTMTWHHALRRFTGLVRMDLRRILVDKCQTRKSAWWFRSYLDAINT